jgi:hypothetical protein
VITIREDTQIAQLQAQLAQMTAERDARPTADQLAVVEAERDARPTLAVLDTEVVTARTAGQGDVTTDPASYSLVTQTSYNAVVAERDARDNTISLNATMIESLNETITQKEAAYVTVVAERDARPTQVSYDTVVVERDARPTAEQLATVEAERDARPTAEQLATVEAERDARPTAEQLATVEAERDARFTEDQIRNMSVDHTVGLNEAGNMQVKIGFIQSADLNTYTPFTVIPDSVSVVNGKICMEFPRSDDENFFFRFRIE